MSNYCQFKKQGIIAVITLSRTQMDNRLNIPFMREFTDYLDQAVEQCTAVVLTAQGSFFCAGGELGDFRQKDSLEVQAFAESLKNLVLKIAGLPIPVLAAVEGDIEGGGINLLDACDIAVAGEQCLFSIPEMKGGISPVISFVGASQSLPKKKLMEMALFSSKLTAREAHSAGLINRVVPRGQAEQLCMEMAEKISNLNPTSIAACKKLLSRIQLGAYEKKLSDACDVLIMLLGSDNAKEVLDAAQQQRAPRYRTERNEVRQSADQQTKQR